MTLASIWRHPIKALSREELAEVTLTPGATLPLDRHWAVTHKRSRLDGTGWAAKHNFLRGVTGPELMAITAETDDAADRVRLHHPRAAPLDIAPDDPADARRLTDWLEPLWPEDQPRPTGIAQTPRGFTDVPEPWISIGNLATHRAVSQRVGHDLSIHRWRMNLWLDGLVPWQEFEWPGQQIRVGAAVLQVRERVTRCKATMANPETGRRDVDTLAALRTWDHQDFGVYAAVVVGGRVASGDAVTVP